MSAHTPGPWHDDGYRIYAPTEDSDKRNGRVIVDYKHIPDFNHADARLIAAAPALLEVLQGILGPALLGALTDEEIIRDFGALGMSHVNFARAAIARAKG